MSWLVARHAKTVILRATARANNRALETFTLCQIFILNGDYLQPSVGSAECPAADSGGRYGSTPPFTRISVRLIPLAALRDCVSVASLRAWLPLLASYF